MYEILAYVVICYIVTYYKDFSIISLNFFVPDEQFSSVDYEVDLMCSLFVPAFRRSGVPAFKTL